MTDVLELADFEPVVAAILAEPLVEWGYEEAAKCVWNVATRFLPGDVERYERVECEVHWSMTVLAGQAPMVCFGEAADKVVAEGYKAGTVHGYTDMVAYAGDGVELVDWKTASELDKAWAGRLVDSWQWRIYCAAHGADSFRYRGIDKSVGPKTPGEPYDWTKAPLRELVYAPGPRNGADVANYLGTAMAMRDVLSEHYPLGRWPRRMPDACRTFGSQCPFWDDCRDGGDVDDVLLAAATNCVGCGFPKERHRQESWAHHSECTLESYRPRGAVTVKAFSHSGIAKFLNCPESYRLSTLTGRRDSSYATDLGSAVHRGVAALYAQFNEIKEAYGRSTTGAA